MHFPVRKKNPHTSPKTFAHAGFSLPEVMIGSVILASAVSMTAQLSNSTMDGMQRMDHRARLDSAMAARIEDIREAAFNHLCLQGCVDTELTQQLKYDLSALRPLCESAELGSSLLAKLKDTSEGRKDLTNNFHVNDYAPDGSNSAALPQTITSTVTASGNLVNVTLSESSTGLSVTTSIVPHAQGWCR